MADDDCDDLVAAVLAACDAPASRRLILDAWGAADRPAALRALLGWVRDHVEAERVLALRGGFYDPPHPPGEVRGGKARPAGVGCWWLGERAGKTVTTPATGWAKAGEKLPKEARYWAAESQGWWYRVPAGGG